MPSISGRAWKGGNYTSLTPGWAQWARPIDVDLRYGLALLRSRAREQAQNNDYVRGLIHLLAANVIGHRGIGLQAKPRLKDGRPDKRGAEAIESAWEEWQKRGSCEASGAMSWRDVCRVGLASHVRDGEFFLRMLPGFGPQGFAVELIDPESIDLKLNEDRKGRMIRLGIELDSWRRPVAYYIRPEPGPNVQSYDLRDMTRIPASEIVHAYLPEWVWQTRGIPWIATSLTRLHHLSEYEEAELIAAQAGASKPGHYKKTLEAVGSVGTDKDLEGQLIDDVRKGEYGVLPPGWDFQLDDPTHPAEQYGSYIKSVLRGIATGLGVGYNTLANDLEGVNYSSLRHGALAERAIYMLLQEWWIETVQEPIYRAWLDSAARLGAITTVTGASLPYDRITEMQRVRWQPRRWAWVDPQKDIIAAKEAVALRTRSVSSIIREQGEEPEDVWRELAEDIEMLKALGIEPGEAISGKPAEPEEPEEPEPEDKDAESKEPVEEEDE